MFFQNPETFWPLYLQQVTLVVRLAQQLQKQPQFDSVRTPSTEEKNCRVYRGEDETRGCFKTVLYHTI